MFRAFLGTWGWPSGKFCLPRGWPLLVRGCMPGSPFWPSALAWDCWLLPFVLACD
ncbi:MAG: hypothetical protein JOZ63_10660 [Planctomycetaceae bacterium]|nr:hypothetical protein [Planctomycetaceae bacterium]